MINISIKIKNIFINDINKIPEKYFSLNLDEYDEIMLMINSGYATKT
jgi:hypothetical protein